jgi:tartrate/fumarate subfamily iron-sulfur-dependent hydro-lyase alpha chain
VTEEGKAVEVLDAMIENSRVARERREMICQDTGVPFFWVRVGHGTCFASDPLEAISTGVEEATLEHCLRPNCVDVLTRRNTGTNRGRGYPVVHIEYSEPAEGASITVLAKGSGSESRSKLAMLDPVRGLDGIKEFVLRTVAQGAPWSCPPVVVGIGLGGSFDSVALHAKRALLRPLGVGSPDPVLSALEEELLGKINALGIGPMGLGGRTTALSVAIESGNTHLTLNPVAVNLSCWAHRRASATISEEGFEVVEE